jgi:hypothetical protein
MVMTLGDLPEDDRLKYLVPPKRMQARGQAKRWRELAKSANGAEAIN